MGRIECRRPWFGRARESNAGKRRKELLHFATIWMELESIMLSEISQELKEKYHMISPVSRT